VTDSGDIYCDYFALDGTRQAYLDHNGVYTTFAVQGAFDTIPIAANSSGEVTGVFNDGTRFGNEGFAYIDGRFVSVDPPGSIDTDVFGINSAGDIVGYTSTDGQTYYGFLAQPVPEPSAWALTLVGFAGLGVAARRRREGRSLTA
jgi:hypothetical protein